MSDNTVRTPQSASPFGSMYFRIGLLLLPAAVTVAGMVALNSYHPPASGSLDVREADRVGLRVGRGVNLTGLDQVTEVTLRDMPLIVSADRIVIDQNSPVALKALRIEPMEGAEIAIDLPPKGQRREISFKLRASTDQGTVLKHQSTPDRDGFYVHFDVPDGGELAGQLLVGSTRSRLAINVRGVRLIGERGATSKPLMAEIPVSAPAKILLDAERSVAGVSFAATQGKKSDVLSVRYDPTRPEAPLTLLRDADPDRLSLVGAVPIRVDGEASLTVKGRRVDTFSQVTLRTAGTDLRFRRGLEASVNGFAFMLVGTFDSVGVATVSGEDAALPSMLKNLTSLSVILLGAVAFLFDKIMGIYGFVRPRER